MVKKLVRSFDQYFILRYILKWFVYVLPVAIAVGSSIALFLWLLEKATLLRFEHGWLFYFLPLAGVGIVALYQFKGKNSDAGNNLVMDEIHKPGGGIPFRMAPFVLFSTVATHLFGGSAGREGTAVQIGGSVSGFLGKVMKLKPEDLRILLMVGIAAGFGAVFGTPVAGTIFAMEVLAIGRIKYDALLPCLMGAVLADMVCSMYGIHHTHYAIAFHEQASSEIFNLKINYRILLFAVGAGILFGLAGYLFSEGIYRFKAFINKYIKWKYGVPFVGGLLIILLTILLGTKDYLGLGVVTESGVGNSLVNAFKEGGVDNFSWFWKIVFTVITLSTGFKGGEVTPLFFIGAALGNVIGAYTGMPVDLFAGLGFIAVFAGATNTPLACTIMGVELFGGEHVVYFAVACFMAYYFSGHSGIYSSQRVSISKGNLTDHLSEKNTLKHIRERKMNEK
jgi:H+/Cl- antiporter ClcA